MKRKDYVKSLGEEGPKFALEASASLLGADGQALVGRPKRAPKRAPKPGGLPASAHVDLGPEASCEEKEWAKAAEALALRR